MKPSKCPECNKVFKNSEELWYHIEEFHRGIPIATDKRCPMCDSEDITFSAIAENGSLDRRTAEFKNSKKRILYFCNNCKKLLETKRIYP